MPAAALALAAVAVGISRVRTSKRDGISVTWHRIPWEAPRRRVVHLTDVHVGPTTPRSVLERVTEVVHTIEPDVVVLTGDYVNASCFFLGRVTEFVRELPKPCVAVLGNHDHFSGADRVSFALRTGGAKVLRNESAVIESKSGPLAVVGVDDGRSKNADVDLAFRDVHAKHALVLSHDPNTAPAIAKTGAPLVLSGHTHGGQVDVPHATPFFARLSGNPYLHGFYRLNDTELYVNAGIGHSLPGLRAGRTCPEIAVFELDPGAKERRSCRLQTSLA